MSQNSIFVMHGTAAMPARQEMAQRRADRGRKAILGGSALTMVAMVIYCYSTLAAGPDADLFSALFQNGVLGWGSFLLMVLGVGMWFAGNVALLDEADRAETGL